MGCLGSELTPVTTINDGKRSRVTWCSRCWATTTLLVRASPYAAMPFRLNNIPRIPADSVATLRGAISEDDFEYFLGQLPGHRAPGSDQLPYELLRQATKTFKGAVLDGVNEILTMRAPPPASWLGGQIRFLFKRGDPLDASCYRPVCLQDCVYKLLSAILTDRLYRLAERHGLLDPSQEGFRRLHSTQRQVQSLHWAFEQAAEQRKQLWLV